MRTVLTVLVVMAAMAGVTPGYAATMSKESYKSTTKQIDATFKTDKEECKALKGNAKDICMEEAKAKQKIAKADAEAEYKGTAKARIAARNARADAEYAVAKEKCDDLAGNAKDVCVKEAKAARVSAKADAKVSKKAGEARKDVNEARRDANQDKRDAEYKVAVERCDAMAGDAKSRCVKDAKARFGKT